MARVIKYFIGLEPATKEEFGRCLDECDEDKTLTVKITHVKTLDELTAENERLSGEISELKNEISRLKTELIIHKDSNENIPYATKIETSSPFIEPRYYDVVTSQRMI